MSQVIGVTVCPNSSSAQLGVLAPGLPQNEVFRIVEPQHEVFVPLLPQNGVLILSHNEVLKSVPANCQLLCNLKIIVDFVLDVQVKGFRLWTWILLHGTEKLGFTIRIVMESLQCVLEMYTWSPSENQASVKFKCRLGGVGHCFAWQDLHPFRVLVLVC